MKNDLNIKLIAVISSIKLALYEAKGIKIIKDSEEFTMISEKHHHHNQSKTESHYQKKSTPRSLFEPHSAPKDIEYSEAAKKVADILEKKIQNNPAYEKLIIVAEPKMLGHIRQSLSNNLKKILYKEISKNLVDQEVDVIEHTIFT